MQVRRDRGCVVGGMVVGWLVGGVVGGVFGLVGLLVETWWFVVWVGGGWSEVV